MVSRTTKLVLVGTPLAFAVGAGITYAVNFGCPRKDSAGISEYCPPSLPANVVAVKYTTPITLSAINELHLDAFITKKEGTNALALNTAGVLTKFAAVFAKTRKFRDIYGSSYKIGGLLENVDFSSESKEAAKLAQYHTGASVCIKTSTMPVTLCATHSAPLNVGEEDYLSLYFVQSIILDPEEILVYSKLMNFLSKRIKVILMKRILSDAIDDLAA